MPPNPCQTCHHAVPHGPHPDGTGWPSTVLRCASCPGGRCVLPPPADELADLVIEYTIDGGETWWHGKTVARWVGADRTALSLQRQAVRELARADHGRAGAVATRVLAEDDPRAVLNQPRTNPPEPAAGGQYPDDAKVTITRLQLVQVLGDEGLIVTGTGRGDQVFGALVARAGRDRGPAPVPVGLDHWQEPRYGR